MKGFSPKFSNLPTLKDKVNKNEFFFKLRIASFFIESILKFNIFSIVQKMYLKFEKKYALHLVHSTINILY